MKVKLITDNIEVEEEAKIVSNQGSNKRKFLADKENDVGIVLVGGSESKRNKTHIDVSIKLLEFSIKFEKPKLLYEAL